MIVFRDDRLKFSKLHYKLLCYMIYNPGKLLTVEELQAATKVGRTREADEEGTPPSSLAAEPKRNSATEQGTVLREVRRLRDRLAGEKGKATGLSPRYIDVERKQFVSSAGSRRSIARRMNGCGRHRQSMP